MPAIEPRDGLSERLRPRDLWLGWLFVASQFALLGVLGFEVWRGQASPSQRLLGALAAAAGVAVMVLGSRRLGRELRTHPAPSEAAVLRVDGPYRFVRHPIYAGLLLFATGLAMVAGSLPASVAFVGLLALLSVKALFEERLLAERFPAYPEYARRTPRFLPRRPQRR